MKTFAAQRCNQRDYWWHLTEINPAINPYPNGCNIGASSITILKGDTGMVELIDIEIQIPPTFPEKYRDSLILSAELCKVKKHMEQPPKFNVITQVVEVNSLK